MLEQEIETPSGKFLEIIVDVANGSLHISLTIDLLTLALTFFGLPDFFKSLVVPCSLNFLIVLLIQLIETPSLSTKELKSERYL